MRINTAREAGGSVPATFKDRLGSIFADDPVLLCVGIDPNPNPDPGPGKGKSGSLRDFSVAVIDATAPHCRAYKFQFAHFAARAAEGDLEEAIRHVRTRHPGHFVILDAKRGDIGSTAAFYAREAFDRYDADAVTVNPYLGFAALDPFFQHPDRGAFVLCRTTGPGGEQLQCQGSPPLWRQVALAAQEQWQQSPNLGLVVGATDPGVIASVRQDAPELPLLIPGVGAQGGSLEDSVRAGRKRLIISASRRITNPFPDLDRVAAEAESLADGLRAACKQLPTGETS